MPAADLSPERRQQIDQLFELLLDLAPELRSEALQEACQGDAGLFDEVQTLLRLADDADSFLETPAVALDAPQGEKREGTIGHYRLLELVGQGGMASVYKAERIDGQFQQIVAIKIAHLSFAHEEGRRRFEREKQILAHLDHPHIARLLDGGTHRDGCPYLVMEYVAGQDLMTYCRTRRLNLRARLVLFLTVCEAIHFAHQNLVIHRDLKPSNILVDESGRVKILDFGIAKLLEADWSESASVTLHPVLTPRYASPEQVKHQTITTASDVFQLGLLLFEMIADRPAQRFESGDFIAMERVVCQDPAPTLRTGNATKIAADLEKIVAFCLRKEPERRYDSAKSLTEDLSRFLNLEPVKAHGNGFFYRLSKFFQRYRWGVSVACVLVLLLATHVYSLNRNASIVAFERDRAQSEAKKANDMKAYLNQLLWDLTTSAKSQADRERVFAMLLRNENRIAQDFGLDKSMRAELYKIIADIYRNQGWYEQAIQTFERAAALYEQAYGPNHPDTVENWRLLGRTLHFLGRYHRAEPLLARVLYQRMALYGPKDIRVAESLNNLGSLLHAMGRYDEAEPLLVYALDLTVLNKGRQDLYAGFVLLNLGDLYTNTGRLDQAENAYRESVAIVRQHLGAGDWQLSMSTDALGHLLLLKGELVEAENLLQEAYEQRVRAYGGSHPIVADSLKNLSLLHVRKGQLDLALDEVECAREMYSSYLSDLHAFVARSYMEAGDIYRANGRIELARSAYLEGQQRLAVNGLANHPFGFRPSL